MTKINLEKRAYNRYIFSIALPNKSLEYDVTDLIKAIVTQEVEEQIAIEKKEFIERNADEQKKLKAFEEIMDITEKIRPWYGPIG